MVRVTVGVTLFLLGAFFAPLPVQAQGNDSLAGSMIDGEEDFSVLSKSRSDILRQIPAAEDELVILEQRLNDLKNEKSGLNRERDNLELQDYSFKRDDLAQSRQASESKLEGLEDALDVEKSKPAPDDARLAFLSDQVSRVQNELASIDRELREIDLWEQKDSEELAEIDSRLAGIKGDKQEAQTNINVQRARIVQLQQQQFEVEDKINRILIPETKEQEFKTLIAIAFAGLVGVVILGFFSIAHRDETVRRAIFSGESGIQFITLFSLVIAIILFGITGILGAKELAALLGGISGYILGRGTT